MQHFRQWPFGSLSVVQVSHRYCRFFGGCLMSLLSSTLPLSYLRGRKLSHLQDVPAQSVSILQRHLISPGRRSLPANYANNNHDGL